MSKYKIYLVSDDYTEINQIDEVKIDDLLFHFRRYKKSLSTSYGGRNEEEYNLSKSYIENCFKNISRLNLLFWEITINYVDNKIQINCA